MATPRRLGARSAVLMDEAWKFRIQADQLKDTLKEGEQLLEKLGKEGLGWDQTSRSFSREYWAQQSKVLQALVNTVIVLSGINTGLAAVAMALPRADEETTKLFRRMQKQYEGDFTPTGDLTTPRWRRRTDP